MKKIISGIAALALAASVFAVDFAANVQIKGDVAGFKFEDDKTTVNLFSFYETNQKDADFLTVSFTGDRAGASFWLWATTRSESETTTDLLALKLRKTKIWFQPIQQIKVTVGYLEAQLYTERVNWWKVPCGSSYTAFKGWSPRWASGAVVHEGYGVLTEITPIDGLWLALAVSSGAGGNWLSKNGDADIVTAQWGAGAKYQITDLISAGAAFRDSGSGSWKLLTVGADFGNYSTAYYGFLQGKLLFEKGSDWKLGGVTIDNYISYNLGFMKVEGTLPVTLRLGDDPSYMTARVKATIPLDALQLYFVVGTDEGLNLDDVKGSQHVKSAANLAWMLDSTFADNFNIYANVGLNFNVGSANLDCGVEFAYDRATESTAVTVPFVAKIAF